VEVPKETEREIKEGDVAPILERRTELVRVQTGILAIDAAVGGGFVAGLYSLAGDEGLGKSTILLSAAHRIAHRQGKRGLYGSSEESRAQVEDRATRTGCGVGQLDLICETDLRRVLDLAKGRGLLCIDSLQEFQQRPDEAMEMLRKWVAQNQAPCIVVTQLVHSGKIAGGKGVSYRFDCLLELLAPYEEDDERRIIRTTKNRYGARGCHEFLLTEKGVVDGPTGAAMVELPKASPSLATAPPSAIGPGSGVGGALLPFQPGGRGAPVDAGE
jgi:DNA repair protein RadA/Sms